MKLVSTTALSKSLHIPTKDLFKLLQESGLIEKNFESWALTPQGIAKGGEYKKLNQKGKTIEYIAWPDDIEITPQKLNTDNIQPKSITSTEVGKIFELSANKINFILSELGWINKALKGWELTKQGQRLGGTQSEIKKTGVPYVRWPESIIKSKALIESVSHVKGTAQENPPLLNNETSEATGFRDKFKAEHRSADGHFVRSKAETLIDNWLYMAEIVHAYERKLPIEEDVYSDFYIPKGKVYIEYWGYENNPKYLKRKKEKGKD